MFNKYASGIKNEIINALECLHKRILQSKFAEEVTETEIMGLVNAPKLINRQKAEIESLNIELQSMRSAANSYKMHYKTAKSEAKKEFAEELEYFVLHEDIEVVEPKCKDYESYINGANQFRHQIKNGINNIKERF